MNTNQAILPGALVARVYGVDGDGEPIVTWDGASMPSVARRAWSHEEPDWVACVGLRGLVVFENGEPDRPIWIAWLDAPKLVSRPVTRETHKELRLESSRDLVLECGKARVALRSDGRVEIVGSHLLSRATGANKIRGGSVHIN